jgi:hypothetical protein
LWQRLRNRLTTLIDADDATALVPIIGICLVGYGAYRLSPAWGLIVAGVVILLYVRPLGRWIL